MRFKTGKPETFRSALVPPYIRKTRTLEAALPRLYLKGVSSGEMGAALEVLVGPEAKGLSASTVSRLKQTEREAPGPLGMPMGRRRLQRAEGRTNQTVRPGDYRCE